MKTWLSTALPTGMFLSVHFEGGESAGVGHPVHQVPPFCESGGTGHSPLVFLSTATGS